jgi:hypothetical protein
VLRAVVRLVPERDAVRDREAGRAVVRLAAERDPVRDREVPRPAVRFVPVRDALRDREAGRAAVRLVPEREPVLRLLAVAVLRPPVREAGRLAAVIRFCSRSTSRSRDLPSLPLSRRASLTNFCTSR